MIYNECINFVVEWIVLIQFHLIHELAFVVVEIIEKDPLDHLQLRDIRFEMESSLNSSIEITCTTRAVTIAFPCIDDEAGNEGIYGHDSRCRA